MAFDSHVPGASFFSSSAEARVSSMRFQSVMSPARSIARIHKRWNAASWPSRFASNAFSSRCSARRGSPAVSKAAARVTKSASAPLERASCTSTGALAFALASAFAFGALTFTGNPSSPTMESST